jgi:hypothetical protein
MGAAGRPGREAMMYRLITNWIILLLSDHNGLQIDGDITKVMSRTG